MVDKRWEDIVSGNIAPAATPEPEPWTPVGSGPYDVGVATIVLDDAQRPLTVDVWFPIVDGAGGPAHRYTLLPDVYYESPDAVSATAACSERTPERHMSRIGWSLDRPPASSSAAKLGFKAICGKTCQETQCVCLPRLLRSGRPT